MFLLFTGMPHQQPPISIPPPGHPPAPAPHVNPAFFPPQHGGPPPTMVRMKKSDYGYIGCEIMVLFLIFLILININLKNSWYINLQPHAAPGHHDPYRAPPPVSYPNDHYSRPPTERWDLHWYDRGKFDLYSHTAVKSRKI